MTIIKRIALFLFIVMISCNTKKQITTKPEIKDTTSSNISEIKDESKDITFRMKRTVDFLDSNRHYASLCDVEKERMYQSEVDYYRTGNEKYLKAYYKHQKQYNTFVHHCNRFNDSLLNNAK